MSKVESNILFNRRLPRAVSLAISVVITLVQLALVAHCSVSQSHLWPHDYGDAALRAGGLDGFDFVVIGAGLAGSVVAQRLSENPDWNILVLEAGGGNVTEWNFASTYSAVPTYETSLANENHTIRWPRGSYATNDMYYARGVPQNYDRWWGHGNHNWGWSAVLPYFNRSVGHLSVAPSYITLSQPQRPSGRAGEVQDMILRAANNIFVPQGSRFYYYNLPSVAMKAVIRRTNLHIIRHAEVIRVNFYPTNRRAKSVTFVLRGQRTLEVAFTRELVLSAGAIGSPKLLMLSGIGNAKHLHKLKIPVLQDLPVGKNLQDHLVVPLFLEMPVGEAMPRNQQTYIEIITKYMDNKRGPFGLQGRLPLTALLDTSANFKGLNPDIEYHHFYIRHKDFASLKLWVAYFGLSGKYEDRLRSALLSRDLLIVHTVLARPQSVGAVRLASANYQDDPRINPNYLSKREDIDTLILGIQYVINLEQTNALGRRGVTLLNIPLEPCKMYAFKTEKYWRCYMTYFTSSQFDYVGTVRMGKRGKGGCVDSDLRLLGVDNLRVADASIMPNIPVAEVGAATLMIAEKAADFIKNSQAN